MIDENSASDVFRLFNCGLKEDSDALRTQFTRFLMEAQWEPQMNQTLKRMFTCISTGLAIAAVFTAAAHAEYRCNPAPSWVDREACKAAAKGSDELRRFVQRMNAMRINISFFDYVEDTTVSASGARR